MTTSVYFESPDAMASHIAGRLKRLAFVVIGVELRNTVRHNGLLVNVTLGKSINLGTTFVAEQFIAGELRKMTRQDNILFSGVMSLGRWRR